MGLVFVLFALFLSSGCEKPMEVHVYNAPKRTGIFAQPVDSTPKPKRTLGAIVPHGASVFYLKAMDEPERLEGLTESLVEVTKGITFSPSGKPVWKLPEGWKETPGTGMAFVQLEVTVPGKPVSFAVTELSWAEKDWDRYLEDNLNRWRGQLALPNLPLADQKPTLKEVALENEKLPAVVVDLTGTSSGGGGPMMGPMSGGPGGPMSGGPMNPAGPPSQPEPPSDSPLRFVTPEGWVDKGTGPFKLASYEVKVGEQVAEVTVSAARTDPKGNAIMWQSQLMKEAEPSAVEKAADEAMGKGEPIRSSIGSGTLYVFRESDSQDSMSMMIAVIPVEGAEASIFAKVKGPHSLVEAQRDKLLALVATMRIEGGR